MNTAVTRLFMAALGPLSALTLAAAELVPERWRPAFHFTPAKNWMNDPNGMVYYDGEYHLFYQYNPFGDKWGHMSWGHTVSRDLVHWQHLPVALYEENDVMIFSGSAVVDWKNTSGFGEKGKPPMVAIYTGHYTKKPLQNQQIAYSNDRGRTWTKYSGNPVLDIGARDFRDPKVLWHDETKRWVMSVAWPAERKVRFYSSPNLKDWSHLSDFGPAGSVTGIWECPDLFPLKVEGSRRQKWVLIVNVGSGAHAGGSGCQYFVGDFDGRKFTLDPSFPKSQPALWADFAPDFYAAVSWSDIPRRDGRRLWIGWMSNWQYANDVPTTPWRNAMSLPRELTLRQTESGPLLIQQPVRELRKLRGQKQTLRNATAAEANEWFQRHGVAGPGWEIEAEFEQTGPAAEFALELFRGGNESMTLAFDHAQQLLRLDRTRSGKRDFNPKFVGVYKAPLRPRDRTLPVRLFLDTSSLEVFANDGETVLTALVFPQSSSEPIRLRGSDSVRIKRLTAYKLKAAPVAD